MTAVTIEIEFVPLGHQHFLARLRGKAKVVCRSPRPFIDAARELAKYGLRNPDTMLYAYHAGAEDWCLRGNLADVARISVVERQRRRMRQERWRG